MSLFKSLLELIYPRCCAGCEIQLAQQEEQLCLACEGALPETNFHLQEGNLMESLFWGKTGVEHASSFLFYEEDGIVQNILHELKYKGNQKLGVFLGKRVGHALEKASWVSKIDGIVPVPLHPKKQFERGYNQAEALAIGMADSLKIPLCKPLVRLKKTKTQTQMNREERIANVSSAFDLDNREQFEGKHLLLVDDVVTTGSTLSECANTLLEIKKAKVSIAALACAIKM